MTLPDAASLEVFSLAELREVVGRLVGEVRRLQSDNTALRSGAEGTVASLGGRLAWCMDRAVVLRRWVT